VPVTKGRKSDSNPLADLTPRNREVLQLVACGMTNGEIARELGITLDGAKWHLGEIITRLGVGSREEAAAIWRAEQRPMRRLQRWAFALPLRPVLGATMAGASVVGLAVAAMLVLGDGETPADDTVEPTLPNADATPTPFVAPPLFTNPPPVTPDRVWERPQTPDLPQEFHSAADAGHAIVVLPSASDGVSDFIDLGPGSRPIFNETSTHALWREGDVNAASGMVSVVHLDTGVTTQIGEARGGGWQGANTVVLNGESGTTEVRIDDDTASTPAGGSSTAVPEQEPRYELEFVGWTVQDTETTRDHYERRYRVRDRNGNAVGVLDGYIVRWLRDDEFLIATRASGPERLTNLFVVNPFNGEVLYVATARLAGSGVYQIGQHVLWADGYGSSNPGHIYRFSLGTGELVELQVPGLPICIVPFGDQQFALLDGGGTLAIYGVVPLQEINVATRPASFSPDLRYWAVGQVEGRGWRCPAER
jgi:DNA-binding CsgD family transcriptional regulator